MIDTSSDDVPHIMDPMDDVPDIHNMAGHAQGTHLPTLFLTFGVSITPPERAFIGNTPSSVVAHIGA
jgi:hypothetical protein